MKYTVHVYHVVAQTIEVEAGSQMEAIKATTGVPFDLTACKAAEEIVGYLVDEQNDPDYGETRYYDANYVSAPFAKECPRRLTEAAGHFIDAQPQRT